MDEECLYTDYVEPNQKDADQKKDKFDVISNLENDVKTDEVYKITQQSARNRLSLNSDTICEEWLKGNCIGNPCPYKKEHKFMENFVCLDWIRGYCPFGDSCDNGLHCYRPERVRSCVFNRTGECTKLDCKFYHEGDDRIIDCHSFVRGFCIEENCKNHSKKNLCAEYLSGFCPKGKECKKGHPRFEDFIYPPKTVSTSTVYSFYIKEDSGTPIVEMQETKQDDKNDKIPQNLFAETCIGRKCNDINKDMIPLRNDVMRFFDSMNNDNKINIEELMCEMFDIMQEIENEEKESGTFKNQLMQHSQMNNPQPNQYNPQNFMSQQYMMQNYQQNMGMQNYQQNMVIQQNMARSIPNQMQMMANPNMRTGIPMVQPNMNLNMNVNPIRNNMYMAQYQNQQPVYQQNVPGYQRGGYTYRSE